MTIKANTEVRKIKYSCPFGFKFPMPGICRNAMEAISSQQEKA
jgi:hypothetical protein